jgi:hypothetical protein
MALVQWEPVVLVLGDEPLSVSEDMLQVVEAPAEWLIAQIQGVVDLAESAASGGEVGGVELAEGGD